jgi:uncharacterized protein YacL
MNVFHFDLKRLTATGWAFLAADAGIVIGLLVCAAVGAPKSAVAVLLCLFIVLSLVVRFLEYYGYAVHRRATPADQDQDG